MKTAEEKLAVIERLEEQLQEKDRRIEELERELEASDGNLQAAHGGVFIPVRVDDDPSLPVPRLELRCMPSKKHIWRDYRVSYRLVYRHLLDHLEAVIFSETRINSGVETAPIFAGKFHLPFRDGCHIRHDMKALNLRAFAVVDGINHIEELERLPERTP